MDEQDKQQAAKLQWNVIEFIKDLARLGDTSGIYHKNVPGGKETIKEALGQGLIVIKSRSETYNYYVLTLQGLLLCWEYPDADEKFIVCHIEGDPNPSS